MVRQSGMPTGAPRKGVMTGKMGYLVVFLVIVLVFVP